MNTRFAVICLLVILACVPACQKRVEQPGSTATWQSDPRADAALKEGRAQEATELYGELLQKEPDNGLIHYYLGYAFGQTGDHDKEIEHYERAADLGYGDATFYFNLGMALAETGHLERGAHFLQRSVDLAPESVDNVQGLGLVLESLGRNDQAMAAFEKAVTLDPKGVEARFCLARTSLRAGDAQKAREQLKAVLRIAPDTPEASAARQLLREMDKY